MLESRSSGLCPGAHAIFDLDDLEDDIVRMCLSLLTIRNCLGKLSKYGGYIRGNAGGG